jgi:hypothetical protein
MVIKMLFLEVNENSQCPFSALLFLLALMHTTNRLTYGLMFSVQSPFLVLAGGLQGTVKGGRCCVLQC